MFTPVTPYLRATRSFDEPRKQSKRSVSLTDWKPISAKTAKSSASGRAPAIQPVHRSMSRLIDSDNSLSTTISPYRN
jgi:hypothetical protein